MGQSLYVDFASVTLSGNLQNQSLSKGHLLLLQCASDRRPGFDPWARKIPGEGNGNPLQYSCLENPMDRGAWWTTVQGVPKSWT